MTKVFNRSLLVILLLFLAGCSTTIDQPISVQIQSLYQNGSDAFQLGAYKKAESHWKQGLTLATKDQKMNEWTGHFVIGLARLAESSGSYQEAINLAEKALHIANDLPNKTLEAEAYVIIGEAYRGMGDYPKARRHSKSARQIARIIGNLKIESDSIRNLGVIHKDQGQFDLAFASYQESLKLAYEAEDKLLQAKALNNLGELSQRKGQYPDARAQYNESLRLRETIKDLAGQGKVLGNMCRLYQDLNAHKQALKFCKHALKIARNIHDKDREANHLSNIAGIHWSLGKFKQARDRLHQLITIRKALGDRAGEARALNNIALIYKSEGKYEKALEFFSKSLEIKKYIGDRSGQSATYYNIGWTYSGIGQLDQALEYLEQALQIQIILDEPSLLWHIYGKLTDTNKKLHRPGLAIFFGKLAVNSIQSLRAANKNLEKYLQKSYLDDKRIVYEQLANLLIDKGRLPEAQQVLVMLKEEEFYDFIRRDNENDDITTAADYSPTEAEWQQVYQKNADQLVILGEELHALKSKKRTARTDAENARLLALDKLLDAASRSFQQTLVELATALDHTGERIDSLENDLTGLVGDLGEGVVLLHTVILDESMWILLTTSEIRKKHKINVTKSTLNQHIHALRTALGNPQMDPRPAGQALYELLFIPELQADLQQAKTKTLMVSLDGALRYIPFAALYDGERYLIEHFALSSFNDAVQQNMKDQPKADWEVAGLGTSLAHEGFSALTAVPNELEEIVLRDATDPNGVLKGVIYLDQDFNQSQLRMILLDEYPVLHIASHFQFKPGTEKNSFLLLGDGSHLDLAEIRQGNYNFKGVDLLTLSACNTAIGDNGEGREVEGFAVLAQKKGAKGILATLWSVADQSTSLLMQMMYRLHQTQQLRLSKAEALRQAQLALLRGTQPLHSISELDNLPRGVVSLDLGDRPSNSYAHPYFWAPFILMGNWL